MNMIKILLLLALCLRHRVNLLALSQVEETNPKLSMKRILVACRHDGMDNH